jgi:hypothetical protein
LPPSESLGLMWVPARTAKSVLAQIAKLEGFL